MAGTTLFIPRRSAARPRDDFDELRTFVTLTRTHHADIGMREVFVRLDNGERARLMYGESCTREVLPGRHRLRVHNTLMWRTIDFAVEPGEHLRFAVLNHRGDFLQSLLAFLPSPVMLYVTCLSTR